MKLISIIQRFIRFNLGVCEECGGELIPVDGWKKYECIKCKKES